MNKRKSLILTYAVVLVAFFAIVFFLQNRNVEEPQPEPTTTQAPVTTTQPPTTQPKPTEPALHSLKYPIGYFGPDEERLAYVDKSITLRIPRLDFEGPVLDGTTLEILKEGVGLFEQAQLPGPENRNVSIAGHRDIHGKEFYYIDTMVEGDLIYLDYQGKEYTYQVEEIMIVNPDDWEPVRIKDYSCISLQSCTPINVASHRIFVVGRLMSIAPVGSNTAG